MVVEQPLIILSYCQNKQVKILQLIQKKQLRGAEVFAAQLSAHLTSQGHQVLMVALLDGKDSLPFDGAIKCLHVNLGNKMMDVKSWRRLAAIIKDFHPDIVQANAGDTLKYAVFSKLLFRWKQPIVFRNASMVSHYATSKLTKLFMKLLFSATSQIISVSNITKKDLIEHFLSPASKITVIPVGVEMKPIASVGMYDRSKINIIHVGGFSFEKNHKGLLSIFSKLISENENYRLWLLGEGPLKADIEKMTAERHLSDKVSFLGFVGNPMDYIHEADVLVLPSIIEGLPGVITEAFYCKTPVVANNVGGISDLIVDCKTGRLIKTGDEDGFVKAVKDLTSGSETDRHAITTAAYEKVIREFTNKQIAVRFADVYSNLLNNKN